MEERKDGRMEGWKNGRLEECKAGRIEGWKNGRMEEWKDGNMGRPFSVTVVQCEINLAPRVVTCSSA